VTAASLLALAAAGALMAADWLASWRGWPRVRWISKPGVMLALMALALALRRASPPERAWFLAALAGGLLGDVFLLLPERWFLPGLVAFLAGHLAYVAGFRYLPFFWPAALAGAGVAVGAGLWLLPRLRRALLAGGQRPLVLPVYVYAVAISAMLVSAFGSGKALAAAGGLLFFASDVLLAWYRFVRPLRWGQPVNIVLYQVGQLGLVASLAS